MTLIHLGRASALPHDAPFTYAAALAAGAGRHDLRDLLESGVLRRLLRGVYAAAELPDTQLLRARAIRLVVPDGFVVTDESAGWLAGRGADDPAPGLAPAGAAAEGVRHGPARPAAQRAGRQRHPAAAPPRRHGGPRRTRHHAAAHLPRPRSAAPPRPRDRRAGPAPGARRLHPRRGPSRDRPLPGACAASSSCDSSRPWPTGAPSHLPRRRCACASTRADCRRRSPRSTSSTRTDASWDAATSSYPT